jgi:hypothetical protein
MTASGEPPTIQSLRETGEKSDETRSDPQDATIAALQITAILEDLFAQIDRNLELADQHLARA